MPSSSADDLAHPGVGVQFESLHQGHHQGAGRHEVLPFAQLRPQGLGRNGQDHELGAGEDLGDVGGRGDARRKGDVLEVLLVAVLQVDLLHHFAAPAPEPDVAFDAGGRGGVGEDLREGGPPGPGAEDGDRRGGAGLAESAVIVPSARRRPGVGRPASPRRPPVLPPRSMKRPCVDWLWAAGSQRTAGGCSPRSVASRSVMASMITSVASVEGGLVQRHARRRR